MPLRAAIHLPQDGVGNCRQFAHLLKAEAQQLGARFRFQQDGADAASPAGPSTLLLADGEQRFRRRRGLRRRRRSAALLAPLGLQLPLLPVWGYSLTAPLRHLDGTARARPAQRA